MYLMMESSFYKYIEYYKNKPNFSKSKMSQ